MIKLILPTLLLAILTTNAHANCIGNSKTLFSCMTVKGKQIEVCDEGRNIVYSYGIPDKPEITLKVPREKASKSTSMGNVTSSVVLNIPSGNTTYVINAITAIKYVEDEYGVMAILKDKNGKEKKVADIKCSTNKKVINNLADANVKEAEN